MKTETQICIALDDLATTETFTNVPTNALVVRHNGRLFGTGPADRGWLRLLAEEYGVEPDASANSLPNGKIFRLSRKDAASVGLTEEELAFASEVEFAPNAPHQFPAELLAEWEREDAAEADQDELLESRRAITVEFRKIIGRFGPALQRQGFGQHIRELTVMLSADPSEFDAARADELLCGIQSFALSLSNSF